MKFALFLPSIAIELVYITLFLRTIRHPPFRFWPPSGSRSWQFFTAWILAALVFVGFFFVGLLDFNSGPLHTWLRFPLGFLCHLVGAIIGSWANAILGFRATLGLGDRLVTRGPYRFSRNPQYIGDMLHILGYMLITNAWMAWLIGALGILLNLLAPHTEESWLLEKFGPAYADYCHRVPRFLGKRVLGGEP